MNGDRDLPSRAHGEPNDAAATPRGSAAALERALAALGLGGAVEVRGSLAILALDPALARDPAVLGSAEQRERAVQAASRLGFTHLALEVGGRVAHEPGGGAHRRAGAAPPCHEHEADDAPLHRS